MRSSSLIQDLDSERFSLARTAGELVVGISDGHSLFSGLAWRQGLVVAPAERLARSEDVEVTGTSGRVAGKVIAVDLASDVGVIRCDRVWSSEARPGLEGPAPGASVALVGREGPDLVVGWCAIRKVGAAWRSRRGARIDARIEVDAGAALPLEGSAIVGLDGSLIGMAVHGPRRLVLGIPAATIERTVADVATHGRLRRGYLGVSLLPLPLSREVAARWQVAAQSVLVVADVSADSPAARAGIEVGDLLIAADGVGLDGVATLNALIRDRGPEGHVRLARRRGSVADELDVALGERPAR